MASRLTLLALAALLGACEDEVAPAQQPSAAVAAKPAAAAKVAAVDTGPSTVEVAYNPIGKRDPFRSYLAELSDSQLSASAKRKTEATESYELDQYRLTGLLTGTSQPKAMVEDPAGRGHLVKTGTHLGKKGGVVTRITSTGIVVTEEYPGPAGEKIRVPISINIPQPELEMVNEQ